MDWVLRVALDGHFKGLQINAQVNLTDLDYADDILLLSDSLEDVQVGIDRIQQIGAKVGLKLNAKKTVWMPAGLPDCFLVVNNEQVTKSDTLVYLGSQIDIRGGMANEIDRRLSAGNAAFWSYRRVWKNEAISVENKIKIYSAVVRSIILYASDSWSLTKVEQRKLEVFDRSKVRWILGINWPDKISNDSLFERAGIAQIDAIMRQRRWKWLGQVLRMKEHRWPIRALEMSYHSEQLVKRKRGAPTKSWRRMMMKISWEDLAWSKVKEEQKLQKPHWNKWCAGEWIKVLKDLARNKNSWQSLVPTTST
jgi:hypothetical protein